MSTYVQLLGTPAIRHDERWLEPAMGLPSALLYYLAHQGAWLSREELAFLFWSDSPEAQARKNLRNLIQRVKDLPFTETLEIERSRVRWQVDTDVHKLEEALTASDGKSLLMLYKGELLQGFRLDDAFEYSDWLELERQRLQQNWQQAVLEYVAELEAEGQLDDASHALDVVIDLDPFHEEAVHKQLQTLAKLGQHARAKTLFEAFKTRLWDEFSVEPDPKTVALLAELETSPAPSPVPKPSITETPAATLKPASRHNLPTQLTPFVGRNGEQQRIAEQLADPACRLLTLIAPGGVGKTRLALAVAHALLAHVEDGVYAVTFASVRLAENMIYAITNALELKLSGQKDAKAQLIEHLYDKKILLVLDNLEHLSDGVVLISELLEAAPNLKVLATSRERLHLQAEWLFDLRGLSYPDVPISDNNDLNSDALDLDALDIKTYDALTLFSQRAKRVQADFELDALTLVPVIRLCQLVAGMPLALELAASWLRLLSLEEIVSELEQGLDLLESSTRDTPERHQSIRAVFDTSWQLLSMQEQTVLSKLAMFQGGFSREAARTVAGATLPILAGIVHKSFLMLLPSGRYERHPLVFQYSLEKLKASATYRDVQQDYQNYYIQALQSWGQALREGKQAATLKLLEAELANIRAVFQLASAEHNVANLHHAFKALETYFIQAGKFREGLELFEAARVALTKQDDTSELARAKLLNYQAHFYYRLGEYHKALTSAQQGTEVSRCINDKQHLRNGLNMQGITFIQQGDYLEAKHYLQEACDLAKADNATRVLANYTNNLGMAVTELGSYDEAECLYLEAKSINEAIGNHISKTRNLNNLGDVNLLKQDFKKAQTFFEEGLALAKEMGFQQPLPHLLNGLASSALGLADYPEAVRLAQEALQVARQSGETSIQIEALHNLGKLNLALRKLPEAQPYLQEAVFIAWQSQALKFLLPPLLDMATLYAEQGEHTLSMELLNVVNVHPAANTPTKEDAQLRLKQISEAESPQQVDVELADDVLGKLVQKVLQNFQPSYPVLSNLRSG
ncbi:MAG: tetratricopeptide repeat protein [Deinococcota bacterium]